MATKKFARYIEWAMSTKGAFEKIDGDKWLVKSESSDKTYVVSVSSKTCYCGCPGFKLSSDEECKHIMFIKLLTTAATAAYEQTVKLDVDSAPKCLCGSKNCIKDGMRRTTRKGHVQRYECRDCKRHFSKNLEYGGKWYPPEMITEALSLFCRGLSSRKMADHLRSQRKSEDEKTPTHNTISVWCRTFLAAMAEYLSQWVPSVSQIWSMDDLHLKLIGIKHYLYMVGDYHHRYVLSHDMGDSKAADDVAPVTREAKERAGDVPDIMLRDGARNLNKAIKETNTMVKSGVKKKTHQVTAHLKGNVTNLRHERLNRTIGERIRLPGTIKDKGSKIIAGFIMFYNFIRRHMALGGKTPAESAGFTILAPNPWDAVIRNAFWNVSLK